MQRGKRNRIKRKKRRVIELSQKTETKVEGQIQEKGTKKSLEYIKRLKKIRAKSNLNV